MCQRRAEIARYRGVSLSDLKQATTAPRAALAASGSRWPAPLLQQSLTKTEGPRQPNSIAAPAAKTNDPLRLAIAPRGSL